LRIVDHVFGLFRRLSNKPRHGVQMARPVARLGTAYGAHAIDLEPLTSRSVVYSFGVGEDVSFDLELIDRIGVTIHAFDPTPRSIAWVKAQTLPPGFVLHEVGLASHDGTAEFSLPENPEHISHTLLQRRNVSGPSIRVEVRRLATLARELGHERIDVLKMDIEGAEYAVIDDILASGIPIGQILIEFHHHMPEVALSETERAIDRLNGAGFSIIDVAENGREFSFARASS
jgi:FkbM family methyltransferase